MGSSSKSHRIAVAIYDGLAGFEYGIVAEVFGRERPGLDVAWYEFLPCRVEPGPLRSNHGMEIAPPGTLADLARADTVLIPSWRDPLERPPEPFLAAVREAHANGARLVTVCTGSFVLAHAGLLEGRSATTHWLHTATLQREFPAVQVEEDALYVHDHRISTSAGSAAGLDLCLALVREDFGVTVANKIARRLVAPVHREGGQSQYADLAAAVPEDDGFGPVLDWMKTHLDQEIPLDRVARESGFALRTFQRRFRDQTGLPPHRWLVQQRVAKGRELLETTDLSVEQIATRSGLGSAANLRKHFAKQLGTTPRAYRSTFRAEEPSTRASRSRVS